MYQFGNQTNRFIGFSFPEWQFGYFALFVLVISHSKLELHSVCLVRFLTLWGKLRKVLRYFLNRMDLLENRTIRFIGFSFLGWQFGYYALFVLVLGHSELELHYVCIVRLLTL